MPASVHILCARSRALAEYRPAVLPSLGDALVVSAQSGSRAPAPVGQAIRSAPWCGVLLVADALLGPEATGALLPVLPRTTVVVSRDLDIDPSRLLAAIQQRPAPGADDLVGYLRLRRLPRDLVAAVEDALMVVRTPALAGEQSAGPSLDHPALPTGSGRHGSTLNRRFATHGPLRRRGWKGLLRLLEISAAPRASVEQTAWQAGCDPRTVRTLCTELLGLEAARVLEIPGWEWKLEAALRRLGYVEWPVPSRRSSTPHCTPALSG